MSPMSPSAVSRYWTAAVFETLTSAEQLLQPLVSAPAHRELAAVVEHGDPLVLREQLDAGDALHVRHVRTVDPHEALGVERPGELGKGLVLQVRPAPLVDRDVVVLR